MHDHHPTSPPAKSIRIRTFGDVTVEEYLPNYEKPASGVVERLESLLNSLGDPANNTAKSLSVFMNPRFTVWAPTPNDEYRRQRKKAQDHWLWEYRKLCGHRSGLKHKLGDIRRLSVSPRQAKYQMAMKRQLEYSGIDLVDGKLRTVHRNELSPPPASQSSDNPIGMIFGRLKVTSVEPGRRYVCQCECGAVKNVRRHHLVSGRTKSCGCWKREIDAKRQERKEAHRR